MKKISSETHQQIGGFGRPNEEVTNEDRLAIITWKVPDEVIQYIYVKEERKANQCTLGVRLWIDLECLDDLRQTRDTNARLRTRKESSEGCTSLVCWNIFWLVAQNLCFSCSNNNSINNNNNSNNNLLAPTRTSAQTVRSWVRWFSGQKIRCRSSKVVVVTATTADVHHGKGEGVTQDADATDDGIEWPVDDEEEQSGGAWLGVCLDLWWCACSGGSGGGGHCGKCGSCSHCRGCSECGCGCCGHCRGHLTPYSDGVKAKGPGIVVQCPGSNAKRTPPITCKTA
ncbi:hypothetical protein HELRODRAFT_182971 [Helobdella robusta]|uniref:Spt6 SH2 domain-containing protein n=1 Tax=Helobdella robusta TaxID=6412 RepID=T1FJ06_HELRO|nr:hypothetical protein HELRODRAFT_182971 [Helobdella robusta]ESN89962.1 hypothetical protein HELRODRAFT_182971 [Helobdella robusta]